MPWCSLPGPAGFKLKSQLSITRVSTGFSTRLSLVLFPHFQPWRGSRATVLTRRSHPRCYLSLVQGCRLRCRINRTPLVTTFRLRRLERLLLLHARRSHIQHTRALSDGSCSEAPLVPRLTTPAALAVLAAAGDRCCWRRRRRRRRRRHVLRRRVERVQLFRVPLRRPRLPLTTRPGGTASA